MNNQIVFIGNARCFHTLDWYRCVSKVLNQNVVFLTDLINSESHNIIITSSDNIQNLFNIDSILLHKQSRFGDVWRNLVKFVFLPIQIYKVKKFVRNNSGVLFHAHTMYYMLLCYLSGVDYVGTPQGSEILLRPFRSKLYKLFAIKSLKNAVCVTVDSNSMANVIKSLAGIDAVIIQNGIDVVAINGIEGCNNSVDYILSIRGMTELYQIQNILKARDQCCQNTYLKMLYPFFDINYLSDISKIVRPKDQLLGKLEKNEMYKLFKNSRFVVSIPISDSSPRSVYEAIFCGCLVFCNYHQFLDILPKCMRNRIYVVDLQREFWLSEAMEWSSSISVTFNPSNEAIVLFDQLNSAKKMVADCYRCNI